MNHAERTERITRFLDEHCFAVLRDKGAEYSRGEEDVNSNFKRSATAVNIDEIDALYVLLSKHLDSIAHYVKTRERPSGESIESRIGDAVNYLLIMASMLAEQDDLHAARLAAARAAQVSADIADAARLAAARAAQVSADIADAAGWEAPPAGTLADVAERADREDGVDPKIIYARTYAAKHPQTRTAEETEALHEAGEFTERRTR